MSSSPPLVIAAPAATILAAEGDQSENLTAAENEIYGNYVADAGERALYMFPPVTRGKGKTGAQTTCHDACARAWPPVLAADLPEVGAQFDKSLLGTDRRKDGSIQLTYGGWPLY